MKATVFEFVSRTYEPANPELVFNYRMHFSDADPMDFTETIALSDADWSQKLPSAFIENILDDLHLILGVSYYKTFCPPSFKTEIALSEEQAAFWNTVYKKGLGEFLYRNDISPDSIAQFSATDGVSRSIEMIASDRHKVLVGIGGGKDSIVALELLKDYERIGFIKSDGHGDELAKEVTDIADVPLLIADRKLDEQLLKGIEGAYNGHIPISAVYAFLGVLHAALVRGRYFVVANEHSSNFGNFIEEGNEVNHKWSGSVEFESMFQTYIRENLTKDVGYFSVTRPFYELRVVEEFVKRGEQYYESFSSCNRNFSHSHDMEGKKWCGECPKCAFAYLMLAAFLDEATLLRIFKKNLFEDAELLPLYKDLLGLGDMKPFDCVGTFDESKVALAMASERFAETLVVKEFLPLIGDTSELKEKVFSTERADTVPTQFRMCGMRSALILGYGKEGKATEQYLAEKYPDVAMSVADKKDDPDYLQKQNDFDIIVKTPAIPHSMIISHFTTATHFFFSEVPRENVIGVTGSKGKSTTATLLYEMLKKAGKKVRLVGNIGAPALQSLIEKPVEADELFVFELSSYQLADLDVSPHIAVVTSLFPEHLDYHGTLEVYYDAKKNITRFQNNSDIFVYEDSFPLLQKWSDTAKAQTYSAVPFSEPVTNTSLAGAHNIANTSLAYTVARVCGVSDSEAVEAVANYKGLPHRLMHIGTYKGISFYDDSISTTPESAIAALNALSNVHTVFLGGVDRGYDFSKLEKALREKSVKTVVLFPESGTHILSSEEGLEVLHTDSMEEAVQFAYENTPEGKVCLLSPSAPSYNLYTNFEERGDSFKNAVEKYGSV